MGSTPYRTITVAPGPHGFSAEVTGLQLQRPLPAATLAEVKRAWAEFSVLYFPRQPLTHEQLETFSLQFGEFGHDPYVKPLPGHPNILEIRREATEKASVFGAAWHSDWSFQATPPAATILHSKVTPPVGGRTWFADGYRAYEALSPVFQQLLANLKTVHSARLAYGPRGLFAQDSTPRTMQIIVSESAENTEIHPLVRTHPVSQRQALFINPVYTVGIAGMTEEESKALLGFLFRHMQREEFIYRHQWQPEMLTMWDNRCTMHYAEGGYDGHLRVMHRTTVAGERPR